MKILRCCLCEGELDVVGNKYESNKKVECKSCGFSNAKQKEPEVFVKRSFVSP